MMVIDFTTIEYFLVLLTNMAKPAKKILVVDDNKLLQQVYFDKLVKEGFSVFQAFTGQEAITIAHNYRPDLVILDIMLPGGLNGFDVLEQLRRDIFLKHVPIIMLTDLENEEQTARSLGATDYILKSKKNSFDQLLTKVRAYLNTDIVEKIKEILE